MNTIELMLTGKIEMPLFVHMFKSNHLLQKEIDGLIPTDAITNTEHDLWKSMSYEALQKTNFCLSSFIEHLCKFDNSPGDNLNLFGTIRRIYTFASPGISCTNIYHDTYDLFVSVVQNCFYGPEVSNLVTQIINESLTYKTKKKRTEMAKKEINEAKLELEFLTSINKITAPVNTFVKTPDFL